MEKRVFHGRVSTLYCNGLPKKKELAKAPRIFQPPAFFTSPGPAENFQKLKTVSRTLMRVLGVVVIGLLLYLFQGSTTTGPDSKDMNAFRAVFVTVPNIEVAKKIAQGLVSNKLAACVNIIPQVTSVYEWEGQINEDSELILMIKSKESLFQELEKFVKENHPYSVPEVIALPIEQGSQPYLDWINKVTKKN